MTSYDSGQLDDILSDIKRLLGDTDEAESAPLAEEEPITPPPAPAQPQVYTGEGHYAWNDPSYTGVYYDQTAAPRRRPEAKSHAASPSAYDQPVQPPTRRPEPAEKAQDAPLRRAGSEPPRQRPPQKTKQEKKRRAKRRDPDEDAEMPERKKRKKGWILLLLLLLVAFGVYKLLAKQPINPNASLGERRPGVSTILLAGTDQDGTRTDTLMLLKLDSTQNTAGLVSVPRDTLVNGSYRVPKINGVYGINGGGEEGIKMLMQRITESIGFEPDGYLLVDLDSFVDLVNIMGGVKFKVPMDMRYDDPAQNLHINLTAGEQKLDGVQAMGLVRFRSGYAQADLERVNVQRDFVAAAADQWISPATVLKTPRLLAWFGKNIETNLTVSNMTWVASALLRCDKAAMEMATLPGAATSISGGSYYVLNPYDIVNTVNKLLNPYEQDITVDNLIIRN